MLIDSAIKIFGCTDGRTDHEEFNSPPSSHSEGGGQK